MTKRLCRIGLGILAAAVLARAAEDPPDRIIRNVEKKLEQTKTIRLEFLEERIWKLTGETQGLRGELVLEGESRFRISTEDQVIVSDGTTLWTYNLPTKQVLIDKLVNTKDALLPRQILFQYTRDYRVHGLAGESVLGIPCAVLVFTSETGDVFIPQVKVWVDKTEWIPRKIEQKDINEDLTVYTLENVRIGIPLDPSLFRFTPPKDADVIDMR